MIHFVLIGCLSSILLYHVNGFHVLKSADLGRDFDRSLWPGGRAFEFSCCPGGRDIWIFVRARDHKSFLGVGNLVIFHLTFLPWGREFDSNLLENVKIPPARH